MLSILTTWIAISFIFLSFGDIFINLYNKFCKQKEQYNLLDTFLLGMCFTLIPLSLSSLWLPSNQYILLIYIGISIIYWLVNKDRLVTHLNNLQATLNNITLLQKSILVLAILSILTYILYSGSTYDAAYYHYQQIRWNEDFAAVPGIANIEDRLGFNSNFLLLTSIFTFRSVFGEALYCGIQSVLFLYILCWAFIQFFKSSYNIGNAILLGFLFFLLLTNGYAIADSSTDTIPNFCIFYLLTRFALKSDWYKKQTLLICVLPITLITFKLSSAIFCLFVIWIFVNLIRNKQIKPIIFISIASLLIIAPWLIRNIIISGYLVYPIYSIDLFSFDWKVPKGTAAIQREHIYSYAANMYNFAFDYNRVFFSTKDKIALLRESASFISLPFVAFSPIIILISLIKKNNIDKNLYIFYFISLLSVIFWFVSAPDPRFIIGCLLGCSFLTICILLSIIGKENLRITKGQSIIAILLVLIFLGASARRNQKALNGAHGLTGRSYGSLLKSLLYIQYPTFELPKSRASYIQSNITEYNIDGITIYITKGPQIGTFDILPCTNLGGLPFDSFEGNKIQSVKTIEPRGKSLQDGFRTKKEYIELINKEVLKD